MMHAISLWQPWAAAIALGDKRVETRHWACPPTVKVLAIHAAKRWRPDQREAARHLSLLVEDADRYQQSIGPNSRGAIVAVAKLERCELMTQAIIDSTPAKERAFGGWEPGRYAWVLNYIQPLNEPIPLRGQQGIGILSADVESEVLARAGDYLGECVR